MELAFPLDSDRLSVVLKVTGETCNINCLYCYEKRKPYAGSKFMEPELLRQFLDLTGPRPLTVMLHGGEPLLAGRERIAALLRVLDEHPADVSVSIQTNGTLVNDAWLDLLTNRTQPVQVGVSLDGDSSANAYRVDYRGNPTHKKVLSCLRLLSQRGVSCGIIVVVTRLAIGRAPELLDLLADFDCVRAVKLSPCLDYNVVSKSHRGPTGQQILTLNPDGQGTPGWATSPEDYTDFVNVALDYWNRNGLFQQFLLEPFVAVVRALAGRETFFTHFSKRKDPYVVTLHPDGRIASCDELEMPAALIGHVTDGHSIDEMIADFAHSELADRMRELLSACTGCPARPVCRGGSLPDRLRYQGTDHGERYCAARIELIDHAKQLVDANATRS